MVASEQILQTAERIFLQRGFHRVSMDELAGELGMSKKTLYRHFASKEELLVVVLEHRTQTMGTRIQEILDSPTPFPKKFQNLIELLHHRMSEIHPIFLSDLQKYAPDCFLIIEKFRSQRLPGYFEQILDEGIQAGVIDANLNRALFIPLLVNCIQTLVRPNALTELKLHPLNAIEGILQIFFEGVLTPKGRKSCARNFIKS